ncbi:MAG: ATPase, T2SS/T4P/T4SS family [Acidiferrobacterales bacterium]
MSDYLTDLPFSDLVIEEQPAQCRYLRTSDSPDLERVPQALWGELTALHAAIQRVDADQFRMLWPDAATEGDFRSQAKESLRLRIQRRNTSYGPVYVARRIDKIIRSLDKLGIPETVLKHLRDPKLRAGLVLFSGGPGAGKTTAACALLVDRMTRLGGLTWTAENPVEYDLQGPHGKGQCYQEEINTDEEVWRVLRETVRSAPGAYKAFYIGEIREERAAQAACLAAASGLLVVSTIHADTPQEALMKMGLLAGNYAGVAQSLRAVLALRLEHRLSAANGAEKVLKVQPLFITEESIRMKIREGNMMSLNSDIEQQGNKIMMGAFSAGNWT